MATPWAGGTLRDLAGEVLAIARQGLKARADLAGGDESPYLEPLHAIAAGGPTEAEKWSERYRTVWNGDVRRIFTEAAI